MGSIIVFNSRETKRISSDGYRRSFKKTSSNNVSFFVGGVFLSVTGLEALYADLGHFGRWPVRTSWLFVVLPSVVTNYLGQGALIMNHPEFITSPFYNAGPAWARWPLIILATLATSKIDFYSRKKHRFSSSSRY